MNKTNLVIIIGIILTVIAVGIVLFHHHSLEQLYESQNTQSQLERVFSDCACVNKINKYPEPDQLCLDLLSSWQNDTHFIDSNICKFIELDEAENKQLITTERTNPMPLILAIVILSGMSLSSFYIIVRNKS
ncbi:hypothetical protein [Nitrosopumilus ureiphilus]|uniref:Uncharacterized protein n=1 Tax=Nitrosopumilus ureiphilus TaxID=1470067 RepID=A0A7D5M364_9ARCH|nr:hypothetical protein [Nitrosopumilus ureiphilus]QLH05974.1 hypothetical protein C5F50_01945 [Nitrosopumilus ureiphilus]